MRRGDTAKGRQAIWTRVRPGVAILACAIALALALHGCQPPVETPPRNVVLILIDTLRPDHLGCYGYERATSPNIDRVAAEGIRFDNVISQSPWTLPSVASLFTGLYPTRHQAINRRTRLPLHRVTLAEILQAAGYETAAVISHTLVSSDYNLDQGFDFYDETHISGHEGISSSGVTDVALQWLREGRETPFFLFLHYFDPHYAYLEHEGFVFPTPYRGFVKMDVPYHTIQVQRWELGREGLECLRALYDSEIAFTDHHVGRVLEELRHLGLEESTLLLITGDHGEEFMEHGWLGHTVHLYDETIRVPLILRQPGGRRRETTIGRQVELVDVMPTVLDLLGLDWNPEQMDGRSFLDALEGEEKSGGPAFSEVCFDNVVARQDRGLKPSPNPNLQSVREGGWKAIHYPLDREWELYDLESDPGEREDLAGLANDDTLTKMKQWLIAWMHRTDQRALTENAEPDTIQVMDEETRERLRALGYID